MTLPLPSPPPPPGRRRRRRRGHVCGALCRDVLGAGDAARAIEAWVTEALARDKRAAGLAVGDLLVLAEHVELLGPLEGVPR